MIFTNDKPIYLQMADRLCDEILSGVYKDDDRIPSVREYSVLLEVNTNTAVKAYDELARANIIYNKRMYTNIFTNCFARICGKSCHVIRVFYMDVRRNTWLPTLTILYSG